MIYFSVDRRRSERIILMFQTQLERKSISLRSIVNTKIRSTIYTRNAVDQRPSLQRESTIRNWPRSFTVIRRKNKNSSPRISSTMSI